MPERAALRRVDATPYAASLIEGLRDFGYSLETSLADIIDNSITAGAQEIHLVTDTAAEDPWIAICDDGTGMTEGELIEAMRPGSKNPLADRGGQDLGRFGLGLKCASFAQCRSLTVISRKDGHTSCAIWDLDEVSISNKWEVIFDPAPERLPVFEHLGENGTIVLWRKLDRLNGGFKHSSDNRSAHLNEVIGKAERHVRLVFHRFLSGHARKVSILLNNRHLKPLDPFVEHNMARQEEPADYLQLAKGMVEIRTVTLPHHKKMSQAEWDEVAGPEGHLRTQGLYVYRAGRLIIAGSWLGLAKQTEATKLCRIAVDIPNSMDGDWKIDVRKASAQLPNTVRERLKKVIERLTSTSKRTYFKRGRKLVDADRKPVWQRIQKDGKIIYRPDLHHPVFTEFRSCLDADQIHDFDACVRLLGANLPIEALHADVIGNAEVLQADALDDEALRLQVVALVTNFLEAGVSVAALPDMLKNIELLKANWNRVEPVLNTYFEEDI